MVLMDMNLIITSIVLVQLTKSYHIYKKKDILNKVYICNWSKQKGAR